MSLKVLKKPSTWFSSRTTKPLKEPFKNLYLFVCVGGSAHKRQHLPPEGRVVQGAAERLAGLHGQRPAAAQEDLHQVPGSPLLLTPLLSSYSLPTHFSLPYSLLTPFSLPYSLLTPFLLPSHSLLTPLLSSYSFLTPFSLPYSLLTPLLSSYSLLTLFLLPSHSLTPFSLPSSLLTLFLLPSYSLTPF